MTTKLIGHLIQADIALLHGNSSSAARHYRRAADERARQNTVYHQVSFMMMAKNLVLNEDDDYANCKTGSIHSG